jgi:sugar transferase (PEP-CTERM/EpsH1 system associated)
LIVPIKPALLYLCHRIPYPPNKGDKIRSYHLLRYLREHYRVYLGAFIDNQQDWAYVAHMESLCDGCCFVDLNPGKARIKSISGLLRGQPLTLPYYADAQMSQWVDGIVAEQQIARAMVYSSAMAQYVTGQLARLERRVIDFVDIDSDKWRQYALRKQWPMNWVYRREANKLLAYERSLAAVFDASLFVSSAEAAMFRSLIPADHEKIAYYNNGVDTDYFSPSGDFVNPYRDGDEVLVFTGAMDYWPNIDAVSWFAKEVLPEITRLAPKARFCIVGSNPSEAVKQLARLDRVEVIGRVEDIRPYLQFARAAVAPMRIARGIQNKVLEAMAMEKPVIVSDQGFEGITAEPGKELLLANTTKEYVSYIPRLVSGAYDGLGKDARVRVKRDFSWEANLPIVYQWLEAEKGSRG